MIDLNQKNIFIQVRIKEQTELGEFNDALYFALTEFKNLNETDLQDAVKTRIDKWIAFVKEQKSLIPVEPTIEELEAKKLKLEIELDQIITKLRVK